MYHFSSRQGIGSEERRKELIKMKVFALRQSCPEIVIYICYGVQKAQATLSDGPEICSRYEF